MSAPAVTQQSSQKVRLRPRNEWVILDPIEDSVSVTEGGIVIPDALKDKPNKAVVVAVGRGRFVDGQFVPIDMQPGDVVLHSKYGVEEILDPMRKNHKLLKVRESECSVVIERAEEE